MSQPDTKRARFEEIRDEVMRRIEARIWPQGTLLPTELDLAEEFGCARATVGRALSELADRGVIHRKRKGGTRVATAPTRHARLDIPLVRRAIEETNAVYRYTLLERVQRSCPAWLQAQLSLPEGAEVLHLRCMHHADNRPYQFEDRWINVAAVPQVTRADFSQVGPNEWLLDTVPFSDAEIAMSAVPATRQVAECLAVPEGTPLFQLERTTWFRTQPVTFVRMTFHQGYQMRTGY